MFDEYQNQEIEAPVLILAAAYAGTIIALVVCFASSPGL